MKVIKIGATWCSGCLVMKPRWQEIQSENPWLETEYFDYDESPEVVEKYNVSSSLPVALFLDKEGNELERLTGEIGKDELLKTLELFRDK